MMEQMTPEQMQARLYALERAIFAAVKPADPEPCWWLESDCGPDFCHDHVVEARGREFDLGAPVTPNRPWHRTPLEDAFDEGIVGGYYGQGERDNTARCSVCDELLSYTLTDHGASEEAHYWLETKLVSFGPDEAYEASRLFGSFCPDGGDESLELARDILKVAEEIAAFLGLEVPAEVMA